MSVSNNPNEPSPLNFTLTPKKDSIEIGFTGLDNKTINIACTVFKEPTGFFSFFYRIWQKIFTWGKITLELPETGSTQQKVNTYAIDFKVFKEVTKHSSNQLDSCRRLEEIKYSHFIQIFFLSENKEEKLELWKKLGNPFSQEIKRNLEQALADHENWQHIPQLILTSDLLENGISIEIQKILLSQINENTLSKLEHANTTGDKKLIPLIKEVITQALKNASKEKNWTEVNRLFDLIKSLQTTILAEDTFEDIVTEAMKDQAERTVKQLIPYAIEKYPQSFFKSINASGLSRENLGVLMAYVKSKNIRLDFKARQAIIINGACIGDLNSIEELLKDPFCRDNNLLRGQVVLSAILNNQLSLARDLISNQSKIDFQYLFDAFEAVIKMTDSDLEITKDLILLLIDQINVEARDLFIQWALKWAVDKGQLDFAKELLNKAKTLPENFETLIEALCINGSIELLDIILKKIPSSNVINARRQALNDAIKYNNLEIVQAVLALHPPLDKRFLIDVISKAVQNGLDKIVQAILTQLTLKQDDTIALFEIALFNCIKFNRKDLLDNLLKVISNHETLGGEVKEQLYGYALNKAIKEGKLAIAKGLNGPISKEILDEAIGGISAKTDRETFAFLLGLYKSNEISDEVLEAIIGDHQNRLFSPDVYLELFLSDKLNVKQQQRLRDAFKDFIAFRSTFINSTRDNLVDKHKSINSILEELSKKSITYDYPFDRIHYPLDKGFEFRFYRQALIDFPKDFLKVIDEQGVPDEVTFLGEPGIDAGGLFRDFLGHLIDGLTDQYRGVLNIDSTLGLPRLSAYVENDAERIKSKEDFTRFGRFLTNLFEQNQTRLAELKAQNLSEEEIKHYYNPNVIGNCFDTQLFILLQSANDPQILKDCVTNHLKKIYFSKCELGGLAEKIPKLDGGEAEESWVVFSPFTSKSQAIDEAYGAFLEVRSRYTDVPYQLWKENKDVIDATTNLIKAYVEAGNPPPTHCVFLSRKLPILEHMLLAEIINKDLKYDGGQTFEDITSSTIDEQVNDYCGAIQAIRAGLEEKGTGVILSKLEIDPLDLSKQIQGEQVTIDSLMNTLILPQDATEDMKTQKEWIRQWLQIDPENNLTKFIKSIGGASQLPPGKNIQLEAKDRVFIRTCFFSMGLYSQLPPNVSKEIFFDRINESTINTSFTSA